MLFQDPIAQVVIVDMDTGEVWSLTSPETPFVTSVSIQFKGAQGSGVSAFTVGVDIPYEYAIRWGRKNNTPFKPMNLVKARIGYASGGWTEWVYGNLPSGGAGLLMTAEGLSGTMTVSFVPLKTLAYTISKDILKAAGLDAEKLIRLICDQVGIECEFTEEASSKMLLWGDVFGDDSSFQEKANFIGGFDGQDSMSAIDKICTKAGCQYFFKAKEGKRVLSVHTERDRLNGILDRSKDDNIRKYVLRGILDTSKNQYPMTSFSPTEGDESSWTAGATVASSSVLATGHNTETGEDVEETVTPEKKDEPIVGNLTVTSPQDIKMSTDQIVVAFADIAKKDGRAGTFMSAPVLPGGEEIFREQAKSFNRDGNPGLKMDASIPIGIPDEQIGNMCQVWGCIDLYNGNYYIQDLTHSWTPGNWEMTLGLFRQGSKAMPGDKKESQGGQMKDK